MKSSSLLASACLLGSLCAPLAHAAVINFEDVGAVDCTTQPISSGGFQFSASDSFHCVVTPADAAPNANNGTNFLIEGSQQLLMTAQSGAHFSVSSLDLGISYYTQTSPNQILLTGQLANGGSVSLEVSITNVFQTYQLTGFDDLVSLRLQGPLVTVPFPAIDYYALDNIVVADATNPVPEPASLGLVAAGLLALGVRRRSTK
ncbi:MAG: PEP-CTERM sorting domain-containing protein [Gammaproteobacteria bacterium]